MASADKNSSEKKCAERIKRWTIDNKNPGGGPTNLHDPPCLLFDSYVLCGMLASVISVIFQIKLFAWLACFFAMMMVANLRGPDDTRQILSGVMVGVTSLVVLYKKDPEPIA